MRTLWSIKLYEYNSGRYKVEIVHSESGRRAVGKGPTPVIAYDNAEAKLIYKPGFIESSAIVRDAVRRRIEELNASEIEVTA